MNRTESSGSTLPLTLDLTGLTRPSGPRVGATAEKHPTTPTTSTGSTGSRTPRLRAVVAEAVDRATRENYPQWLAHIQHAAACTAPIRLRGRVHQVDSRTGTVLASTSTLTMPDGVIYTSCGNRRATVCPACSQLYRADTYQLIKAGLIGGKTVPATVATHPVVFLTATAPSFGPVHSTRARTTGASSDRTSRPCRPRRDDPHCPHGRPQSCMQRHEPGDSMLGQPFCLDCYDHAGQVVWNVYVGELWRRTLLRANQTLKAYGARASFAKVAEMQARGVVHLHALIRLDNLEPDLVTDVQLDGNGGTRDVAREVPAPPPPAARLPQLRRALQDAFTTTSYRTPPHPDHHDDGGDGRQGWLVTWGDQLDIRPVRDPDVTQGPGTLTEAQVAGYLAKYATKATEDTGHTSTRLDQDTATDLIRRGDHIARLVDACWTLGRPGADDHALSVTGKTTPERLAYTRLRRWAHMLGFGGHFSTKSRRYSTTLGALRHARVEWREHHRRHRDRRTGRDLTVADTTLLIGELTFAGAGWHTTGDALLANTAAAKAREHAHAVRDLIDPEHLDELHGSTAA